MNGPALEFIRNRRRYRFSYDTMDIHIWKRGRNLRPGRWVFVRKATDADIAALNEAVSKAHHGGK